MSSRQDAAKGILSVPLFAEIMAELETVSVNRMVNAKYDDHEARLNGAAEVKAVREFRRKLEALAGGQSDVIESDVPA